MQLSVALLDNVFLLSHFQWFWLSALRLPTSKHNALAYGLSWTIDQAWDRDWSDLIEEIVRSNTLQYPNTTSLMSGYSLARGRHKVSSKLETSSFDHSPSSGQQSRV